MLRYLAMAGSGLLLTISVAHGPGRGLSLVEAGNTGLGLLVTATYALILCGATIITRAPRSGMIFLLLGLVARCAMELKLSWARVWWDSEKIPELTGAIALLYLLDFIAPALLALDSRHLLRQRPI
ncbi:hypothetical protein OKA04_20780 [Luteolibacter flavescens]|uniref:Uncharacterized protein n=1 Tax=Luteolibacter flavescens TaxID=1859460 RepID=A0ABT3FUC2_9BACT|nr:hypothetical protein [Luteolibacter flavescens]